MYYSAEAFPKTYSQHCMYVFQCVTSNRKKYRNLNNASFLQSRNNRTRNRTNNKMINCQDLRCAVFGLQFCYVAQHEHEKDGDKPHYFVQFDCIAFICKRQECSYQIYHSLTKIHKRKHFAKTVIALNNIVPSKIIILIYM